MGIAEDKLIMIISLRGFENYFKEVRIPIRDDDHNSYNFNTDYDRITLHIKETKYSLKLVGRLSTYLMKITIFLFGFRIDKLIDIKKIKIIASSNNDKHWNKYDQTNQLYHNKIMKLQIIDK